MTCACQACAISFQRARRISDIAECPGPFVYLANFPDDEGAMESLLIPDQQWRVFFQSSSSANQSG
jgi:hypothetical protein